tara:strand:- start:83 stop:415 length:333 start_codon:yes stop_codon:yes gene_type:complete
MKNKSISYIDDYLYNIIIDEFNTIINNIQTDNNITLKKNYININKDIINENINIFINKNIRCSGIIKSGLQCARTRKCNNLFCKIHQKTLKFGKVIYPDILFNIEYCKYN